MIILGIETSCDETAAAVVRDGKEILSNIVASSVEMHTKTGGIIPENAAREQAKSIIPAIEAAIENSKYKIENIDSIAVTIGPGLIGSLLVGAETARTLSWVWNKPLVPVNHLIGHIYANWIDNTPSLPAITLVVSGGHTDLVLVKDHGNIEWIGSTRDDAAGECFDKCARLLQLGYPGGPAIAAEAAKFKNQSLKFKVNLPRPLINEETFDFSFSGLKTAVLREISKQGNKLVRQQLAHEIQEAITDVLVDKTLKAVQKYSVSTLLVAGGVAANKRLKEKFSLKIENCSPRSEAGKLKINFHAPPTHLCTDNAAMIAAAAFYNHKPTPWQKVTTNPGLTIAQL